MENLLDLLDVAALTEDLSWHSLQPGQLGTIGEVLEPGVFEVEFTGNDVQTFALVALPTSKLLQLL